MPRLTICLCLFLCGCNTQPRPPETVSVSPVSLVRTYRDSPRLADDTWLNRPIRCSIPANTYTIRDRVLCYQTGMPGASPCIMFEFDSPPQSTGDVLVCGVCRGMIRDGQRRGVGVDFCVHVTGCSITR